MKTPVFLLVLNFLFCLFSPAQNKYTFSQTAGNAYTDLSGDVNVTNSFPANGLYNIPGQAGETFTFFALPYTIGGFKTIAVGSGPFLRVDNDSSLVIIDAAFTYADSIDASSKISYLVQGSPGNKILKTQYKNLKLRYGAALNFINVQIWYFQQSGIIELHYGPRSTNNASGYTIQNGPNVGIFYSPDNFTGCYEKLWCNGSPAAVVLDSTANYVFKAMSGVPDAGIVYRFSPRVATTQTVSTVGLRENTNQLLSSVSNPVKDKIMISGNLNAYTILIYDLNGKPVKEWRHLSGNAELDVYDLSAGCYFIQMTGALGTQRKKIVVLK